MMPIGTHNRPVWLLMLLAILLLAAQSTSGTEISLVTGLVVDENGKPLSNANVVVPSLDRNVRTDSEGRFVLRNLRGSNIHIEVSHIGYVSKALEVLPSQLDSAPITIVLKETAIDVGQVTVTGTPTDTDPLVSPQSIAVLSAEDLAANETSALGKVLENLPGVSNISTGPQAGKPVIRGLSGNRVRVMKDGVPMEDYQFSFRHQPVTDLTQAERVEVIQGAASILYGSDALGGAANVITKRLPSVQSGASYLTGLLKGQYFSNNNERAGTLELEGAASNIGYRAGLTSRRADNFSTPDAATFAETGKPRTPKFTGELPYTNFEQVSGYAMLGFSSSFGNLWALYDRYDSKQNYLLADGSPVGQNLENDNLKLKGNVLLGSSVLLKPTLSYQRNVRQASEGGSFERNPDWAVDMIRSVYALRMDLAHSNLAGLSGTAGADINVQNQRTLASGLLPNADILGIGIYAFEEFTRERLTLNGGLRFDYREHEAEANAAMRLPDTAAGETDDVLTQEYSVLSGSAGISYRLTGSLIATSNFAIGFRAPDLFELHANGVHGGVMAYQIGDPYLNPERSYNVDGSLRLGTEVAQVRVTVYHNQINNYIFLSNVGRDTTIGSSTLPILQSDQTNGTITGLELSGEVDALPWLRLSATYAATASENEESSEELPLMPADRITVGARVNLPGGQTLRSPFAELRIKHAMDKKSAGEYEPFSQFDVIPFGTASTDAYTILSISVGTTLKIDGQPVVINIEVENALDEEYVDFLDTYKGYALSMGRNIAVRIQAPFRVL